MTTTTQARKTLAQYNEGFRSEGETSDFETVREYRVGKWGVRWSRDGYGSRGTGGDKLHVSVVTAITAVKPDYDWQRYCAESASTRRWNTREQNQQAVERHVADHGKPWHHCRQPQVGDVIEVHPVCRFENVRGTGAWTPEQADTDVVNCLNCRRQFFGEEVDGVEERRKEREGVEARRAAKPKPARCFWCGDIRPRTKATERGEQLPCSNCKDNFETIYWVETTGCYCQYHAEIYAESPVEKQHLLQAGLEAENTAYDRLERVEGKYFK